MASSGEEKNQRWIEKDAKQEDPFKVLRKTRIGEMASSGEEKNKRRIEKDAKQEDPFKVLRKTRIGEFVPNYYRRGGEYLSSKVSVVSSFRSKAVCDEVENKTGILDPRYQIKRDHHGCKNCGSASQEASSSSPSRPSDSRSRYRSSCGSASCFMRPLSPSRPSDSRRRYRSRSYRQEERPRSPPRGPPRGEEAVKYSRRTYSHDMITTKSWGSASQEASSSSPSRPSDSRSRYRSRSYSRAPRRKGADYSASQRRRQDERPRSPPRGPPRGEEDVKYSRRTYSHGYEGATAAAPDLLPSFKCSVVSRFRAKPLCDDPFKGVQNRIPFLHPRKDGKRDHPNCNNCGSPSHEAKACFMRPSSRKQELLINAASSSKEEEINPKDVERRPDEEEAEQEFLFQFSLPNEHVRARGGGGLEFAQAGQRQHVLSWDHPWDSRSYYPPELSSKKRLQKGNYEEEGFPLITRELPREKIESLVSRSDYPLEFSSGKRLQKGRYKEEEYPRVKKDMGQVKRLEKGRNYKEEEEYPRVKKDMGQVVHKMMSKMGYKEGQGLGKDGQGMKDPLIPTGNEGRLGIGAKEPRESD